MKKQVIDNATKEKIYRFVGDDFVGFGRKLSSVEYNGAFWTAVTMETADKNTIVVMRQKDAQRDTLELPAGAIYHCPVLIAGDNTLSIAWNEFSDNTWRIKYAEIDAENFGIGTIEDVYSSSSLCLPPAGVWTNSAVHIVWPAEVDGRIRMMLSSARNNQWTQAEPVSDSAIDAFRPTVTSSGGALHIFWDQYRAKTYELAGVTIDESGMNALASLSAEGERWFCPDATVNKDGGVYLTWVAMQEVCDDLGIADHAAFAMVGKLNGKTITVLEPSDGGDNPRAIGDLREGLLASKVSKGYLGLRRRPMLSADAKGGVWCFWEVRVEAEATAISGHLVGCHYDGQRWSEPCVLGDPGYGYAVPKKITDKNGVPAAHFSYAGKGLDIIQYSVLSLDQKAPYIVDGSKWERWHSFDIEPLVKPTRTLETDGSRYSMFWADTHCHSNFSADAEGEPDELIHYARDIAGLDALCLIDNDFYPNKTLSPAEWQIHLDNSRHFTKEGEFVLFPGYEFTYHRKDLKPDFNHRCVIYPGPKGPLLRRIDKATNSDAKLIAALPDKVICYPHHSSYELMDNEKERNIEACSSWRTVLEENDFTLQQLRAGRKLGFIGSSDAHRANAGLGGALTGLFATELTAEGLYDAYKNRRMIATQGFAAFIDFRVAGLFIGSEGQSDGPPEITAEIEAPHEIEYVRVLRDGEEILRHEPAADSCSFAFKDKAATAGEHFYFLNLKLVGEPGYNMDPTKNALAPFSADSKYPHNLARARGVFAWTSPIWCVL